jgi:hypothetical protein
MELVHEDDDDGSAILSPTSRAVLQRIRKLLERQHLQHKVQQQQQQQQSHSPTTPTPPLWLPCHVIELAKTGELKAHVDSVRFSGDIVAGLSLQSSCIMRLALPTPTADENEKGNEESLNREHRHNEKAVAVAPLTGSTKNHDNNSGGSSNNSGGSKSFVDLHLLPKSLYVLSGPSRYRYTHELLPDGATFVASDDSSAAVGTIVNRQDRLSIIFRDARQESHQDDDDDDKK